MSRPDRPLSRLIRKRLKERKDKEAKREAKRAALLDYWSRDRVSRFKADYTDAQLAKHERNVAKRARKKRRIRAVPDSHLGRPSLIYFRGTLVERDRASKQKRRALDLNRRSSRLAGIYIPHTAPMPADGCCPHCRVPMIGEWPAPDAPTLDHIVPLARGGSHTPDNTQMICFRCNQIKGVRPLSYLLERLRNEHKMCLDDAPKMIIHEKVTSYCFSSLLQLFIRMR